jgi:hypothetical protein
MDSDEYGILINSFSKNAREEIRISINEYKGTKYIDIRTFFREKEDGDFKASKKGVTLSVEKYPEFLECIIQLGESLGFDMPAGEKVESTNSAGRQKAIES